MMVRIPSKLSMTIDARLARLRRRMRAEFKAKIDRYMREARAACRKEFDRGFEFGYTSALFQHGRLIQGTDSEPPVEFHPSHLVKGEKCLE